MGWGVSGTGWLKLEDPVVRDSLYKINEIRRDFTVRGSCLMWRPGWPAGTWMLVVTSAIVPNKPLSVRSSMSITRHSRLF